MKTAVPIASGIPRRNRRRYLHNFDGQTSSMEKIRSFVASRPCALYGLYTRGVPYACAAAKELSLGDSGLELMTATFSLERESRSDPNPTIGGLDAGHYTGGLSEVHLFFDESTNGYDHDGWMIDLRLAKRVKRFADKGAPNTENTRLVIANPFQILSIDEILVRSFFGYNDSGITLEDLGSEVRHYAGLNAETVRLKFGYPSDQECAPGDCIVLSGRGTRLNAIGLGLKLNLGRDAIYRKGFDFSPEDYALLDVVKDKNVVVVGAPESENVLSNLKNFGNLKDYLLL